MPKTKITVVKRVSMKDLFGDNPPADVRVEMVTPQCPALKEGQEFIYDKTCPPGFCSWAFADIQRDLIAVGFGASYPWIKEKQVAISCCTDGLRPVIFRIEVVPD
jgi:uncharacterized repeat protein (TIGR04076 family)